MAPLITLAVLCRRVSQDHEGFTVHGIVDGITLLGEAPPLNLFGLVWVLPFESGEHAVRAVVIAPSGEPASNEYRMLAVFEESVPTKWNFEFEIEVDEEGMYWFLVEVGPETKATFPLGVRWAPDSSRARRWGRE